jgi:L-alanine-DL-glutamate epimerase-like enolase superfamily enzyme
MSRSTDVRVVGVAVYFLPIDTRVPLKFGTEVLQSVTCARVSVTVADAQGRTATGWGETPLSVQWVWPSQQPYSPRHEALKRFTLVLAEDLAGFDTGGHPIEIGHAFQQQRLGPLTEQFNRSPGDAGPMPYLAALLCCSALDIATHDAYGRLHEVDVYQTYGPDWLNRDLAAYLTPAEGTDVGFADRYPSDFLVDNAPAHLPVWHLVGGLDPIGRAELTGAEPDDGYPVLLADWITTDGLKCIKIKLRGNDAAWDYDRLVQVGRLGIEHGVNWLSADFNCTVTDPTYVNDILDRLRDEHPRVFGMILYVEQPFPYELRTYPIDVHSVAARKPIFLDESAHDWEHVALGRSLGWTGVALKTCKTQTGALLSLCWAKAHGMTLMVQDLTNPMLAQVPHVRLAAHAGTIMGVESNGMQFYPEASLPEAAVHPGLYRRREGRLDLSTLAGPGFGYRLEEIDRALPPAAGEFSA